MEPGKGGNSSLLSGPQHPFNHHPGLEPESPQRRPNLPGWTSPLGPLPCSGISLEISLGRAFLLYSSFPELLTGFSVRNLSSAFELWCWRRLLRVPCTARRPNQSILKGINPEYSLKGLMLKLKLQYFGHLMQRADSLEKSLMLGKIESGRKRG